VPDHAKLDALLDREIVKLVLAGDMQAEAELVRRYEPKIKGMIYKKVRNRETTRIWARRSS
jgi:hypothetical protein